MRKRTVKLWRLHEGGRKLHAGTIEAGDPRELVLKWSLFLATAERGVYFATYRQFRRTGTRPRERRRAFGGVMYGQGPHPCCCVSADELGR
jgi:hypothetical protein